tara:strand:- start:551 stop:1159 length:609 start_codon:yes stop_codon:yes gene_type:complete
MYSPIKILLISLIFIKSLAAQNGFKPESISQAAIELTKDNVVYDGRYYSIAYPGGDVSKGKGVCTDVIVRAYRAIGLDLQKEVHEDMSANFELYPKIWGLSGPDSNIDHRRVPNLMTYFERQNAQLTITNKGLDYLPGDIVAWRLDSGLTHIGVVVNVLSLDKKRYKIVHNIGTGQVLEDCLFDFAIIGHYRFLATGISHEN